MCRFGQGIIPLPNPVMSRYEWPCLRAYAGRSTLISDLDKHERTNRQKWLAQERMRLIVAESGCALRAPPDEHDAAGMDLSVWGPRTPGKGVRCIGIQLKSVREDSGNVSRSGSGLRYRLETSTYDLLRRPSSLPVVLVVIVFPKGDEWLVEEARRVLLMCERYVVNLMGKPTSKYEGRTPATIQSGDSLNSTTLRQMVERAPTL